MSDQSANKSKSPIQFDRNTAVNLLKVFGEKVVPGGSQILHGEISSGLGHLAAGIVGKAIFGMPGLLLVSANSLSRTFLGKNVNEIDEVSKVLAPKSDAPAAASFPAEHAAKNGASASTGSSEGAAA